MGNVMSQVTGHPRDPDTRGTLRPAGYEDFERIARSTLRAEVPGILHRARASTR